MKYAILSTLIFAILTTVLSIKLIQARQHPIDFVRSLTQDQQDEVWVSLDNDHI